MKPCGGNTSKTTSKIDVQDLQSTAAKASPRQRLLAACREELPQHVDRALHAEDPAASSITGRAAPVPGQVGGQPDTRTVLCILHLLCMPSDWWLLWGQGLPRLCWCRVQGMGGPAGEILFQNHQCSPGPGSAGGHSGRGTSTAAHQTPTKTRLWERHHVFLFGVHSIKNRFHFLILRISFLTKT